MLYACENKKTSANTEWKEPNDTLHINIFPDSVINDVSHHPVGINMDYFMDDDKYLKPSISTTIALKSLGVKYLRYPGGNKADFYFFSKPPYEKSEPTLARTGQNAVGGRNKILNDDCTDFRFDVLDFDEFISMCHELNAEPVVVVAADEYLVNYPAGSTWSSKEQLIKNAVECVKYSNIKKKYNVKYWMIGNESWHESNPNSTAEIYAQDVIDFSKAMKHIDPSIHIVPNGGDDDFWKVVLTKAAGYYDELCISNYPIYKYKNGYNTYRDTVDQMMGPVNNTIAAINKYVPGSKDQHKIIIAEYGPFDWGKGWPMINNQGMNLANFELTGNQLMEPNVLFSCFWNTRWIDNDTKEDMAFDALDKNGNLNAIGWGLYIWGNYLGDKMVKTTGASQIVRSFGSVENGKAYIYLINKSADKRPAVINIPDYKIVDIEESKELKGENHEDVNPVWKDFNETSSLITKNTLVLNSYSITVLKLSLQKQ